jgi:hypothetical protein
MPLIPVALLLALQGGRFQPANPLPGLPPLFLDKFLDYKGPTKQVCEKAGLEGRILWIDATANIERYNTEEKIVALFEKVAKSGFNTVVFDVKPLSSETVYPSACAPKLKEWRGKELGDFDPMPFVSREARKNGLMLFVSMNAFCEGHRLLNRGPGFDRPEETSVVYEAAPIVRIGDKTFPFSTKGEIDKVTIAATPPPVPQDDMPSKTVVCNKFGVVVEGSTLPKGGYTVTAVGAPAGELAVYGQPGAKITLDSEPTFVRLTESSDKQYPLMTNPNNRTVQERIKSLVREVTTKYDIDGVIFDDRLRYTGLNGDFSPLTQTLFERKLGKKLTWPDDVFKFTYTYKDGLVRGMKPGPYYDSWMNWRANVLKQFTIDVRAEVRKIKPTAKLGVYAGSWYGDYQQYGNNWAAPATEAGFWFMTPEYRKTGFAPELDFLVTGCYYPTGPIFDALQEGRGVGVTVESAGNLSYRAVHDETFVYAGLSLADFKDNPEGLGKALQSAVATTNGVMVFDLSHDIEPMWSLFEKAFSVKKKSPQISDAYLLEARRRRSLMQKRGDKEPPIVISGGASGVGF